MKFKVGDQVQTSEGIICEVLKIVSWPGETNCKLRRVDGGKLDLTWFNEKDLSFVQA